MSIYRKIWESHYNQNIPKGWHIHHIDGNTENNQIDNLICVSSHVHWCIHFLQGDPVALSGNFVQGASEAGRKGGKLSAGWKFSEESKIKLSKSLKLYYEKTGGSPLKERNISEKHRLAIKEANIGEKNPMYGKTHSKEIKERLSQIGKTKTGQKNNFYGKKHSEETKHKLSELAKGRKSPTSLKYKVYDENMNLLYKDLEKHDIMEKLNLTDRQYRTLKTFCNRNDEKKIHPKLGVLLIKC